MTDADVRSMLVELAEILKGTVLEVMTLQAQLSGRTNRPTQDLESRIRLALGYLKGAAPRDAG